MSRLVAESRRQGGAGLRAEVSKTAKPFFAAMGFRSVREQSRLYRGARFAQTLMSKTEREGTHRARDRDATNRKTLSYDSP
jgi:hypothetical protein